MSAVQERLDAIPEAFVLDAFRQEAIRAGEAAAIVQEVADRTSKAAELVRSALSAGDVLMAAGAASQLASLERLVQFLPASGLDPAVSEAAIDHAAARIPSLPSLPLIDYYQAKALWNTLAPQYMAQVEPPVLLPSDLEARKAVDGLLAERQAVLKTLQAWHENRRMAGLDPVNHLAAAAGAAELVEKYRTHNAQVAEIVAAANAARQAAGLTWIAPPGIAPGVVATV